MTSRRPTIIVKQINFTVFFLVICYGQIRDKNEYYSVNTRDHYLAIGNDHLHKTAMQAAIG